MSESETSSGRSDDGICCYDDGDNVEDGSDSDDVGSPELVPARRPSLAEQKVSLEGKLFGVEQAKRRKVNTAPEPCHESSSGRGLVFRVPIRDKSAEVPSSSTVIAHAGSSSRHQSSTSKVAVGTSASQTSTSTTAIGTSTGQASTGTTVIGTSTGQRLIPLSISQSVRLPRLVNRGDRSDELNEFGTKNVYHIESVLPLSRVKHLIAKFHIPKEFEARPCRENETAAIPEDGWEAVYEDQLNAGLRLPISLPIKMVLDDHDIRSPQLSPNSIRLILGFALFCRLKRIEISVHLFRGCFYRKSGNKVSDSWSSLIRRHGKLGKEPFLSGAPSSIPGWKSRYFMVRRIGFPARTKWNHAQPRAVTKKLLASVAPMVTEILDGNHCISCDAVTDESLVEARLESCATYDDPKAVYKELNDEELGKLSFLSKLSLKPDAPAAVHPSSSTTPSVRTLHTQTSQSGVEAFGNEGTSTQVEKSVAREAPSSRDSSKKRKSDLPPIDKGKALTVVDETDDLAPVEEERAPVPRFLTSRTAGDLSSDEIVEQYTAYATGLKHLMSSAKKKYSRNVKKLSEATKGMEKLTSELSLSKKEILDLKAELTKLSTEKKAAESAALVAEAKARAAESAKVLAEREIIESRAHFKAQLPQLRSLLVQDFKSSLAFTADLAVLSRPAYYGGFCEAVDECASSWPVVQPYELERYRPDIPAELDSLITRYQTTGSISDRWSEEDKQKVAEEEADLADRASKYDALFGTL